MCEAVTLIVSVLHMTTSRSGARTSLLAEGRLALLAFANFELLLVVLAIELQAVLEVLGLVDARQGVLARLRCPATGPATLLKPPPPLDKGAPQRLVGRRVARFTRKLGAIFGLDALALAVDDTTNEVQLEV